MNSKAKDGKKSWLQDRELLLEARNRAGFKDNEWPLFLTIEQFVNLQHEDRKKRNVFRCIVEGSIRSGGLRVKFVTRKVATYKTVHRDSPEGFRYLFRENKTISVPCGEREYTEPLLSALSVSNWMDSVDGAPSEYVAAWIRATTSDVPAATGGKSAIPPEKMAPSDHLVIATSATPDNGFLTRQRENAKRKRKRGKNDGSGRSFVAAVRQEYKRKNWMNALNSLTQSKGAMFDKFKIVDVEANDEQLQGVVYYEYRVEKTIKTGKIMVSTFRKYWSIKEEK